MKKTILIGMVLILMLFLLPSCAAGVSQEEYDRVSSDLAAAQTQIQSLQGELTAVRGDLTEAQAQIQSLQSDMEVAEKKPAEALAYAEYLDILLYPVWKEAGLTPRFEFGDDFEWFVELKNRASDMEDTKLGNYIKELEKGSEAAMSEPWDYCLDRIEKALK